MTRVKEKERKREKERVDTEENCVRSKQVTRVQLNFAVARAYAQGSNSYSDITVNICSPAKSVTESATATIVPQLVQLPVLVLAGLLPLREKSACMVDFYALSRRCDVQRYHLPPE